MASTIIGSVESSRRTPLDAADFELVLEQRVDVVDDRVEVDRRVRRRAACPTRQRQQPVDDLRCAERLPFDLLENRVLGLEASACSATSA